MKYETPDGDSDPDSHELKKQIEKLCKELGIARASELPEDDTGLPENERVKRAELRNLSEELTKAINKAGFQTIDPHEFFKGIQSYKEADPQALVDKILPRILEINPDFLKINNLNFENIEEKLRDMYENDEDMLRRYKTGEESYQRVKYSFNVCFKHLLFFMEEHPDDKEFQNMLNSVQKILSGKFFEQD